MSDKNRYEVKTEGYNTNPLGPLSGLFGGEMIVTTYTITDTTNGKEYSSTNYDADKARDDAWNAARNDQ